MDDRQFFIIVQGLFEKSDSIGYDAVFEYKILCEIYGRSRVRIFAEQFDQKVYPGIPIDPVATLKENFEKNANAVIIYHYCDGWPFLDEFLMASLGNFVVRWHNNTPPWFYGATHRRSVERSTKGFRTILKFIENPGIRFWVNSNFTLKQLQVLGADPARAAVVYPGSRFLETQHGKLPAIVESMSSISVAAENRPVRLLFVSRVVAHKGHRHVLMFAGELQRALDREVSVTFLGRDDPATTLKSDLSALGKSEGVEVLLRGEVSEDDLYSAYRQADLFVCFSEHEGFGMPIFEAMRVGLPVLCLGRTALRELMRVHPFMLDDLDFSKAIAATRLLANEASRSDVLKIQSSLLETYTSQVIVRQLKAALAGIHGPWSSTLVDAAGIETRSADIRAQIAANMIDTHSSSTPPGEIADNFVTVYDIESYESLLGGARGLDTLPPHEAPADHLTLSHREFVTSHGTMLDEGIAFSANAANKNPPHVIYGPYEKFVRGYFSADFEFEAEDNGDGGVELDLDVLAEGVRPVSRRKVTVRSIRAGPPPRLLFPIVKDGTVVEFRVRVSRRGNGNLIFKGVTIRNMRQTVASLRDREAIPLRRLPWFKFGAPVGSLLGGIPPLAKKHFARGDQMRDGGRWSDAAEAYAAGLSYYPAAFPYFIQLGNCLKEAKRYEESEKAYQQALTLKPDDQDAHLQIARLYRMWDRPEEFNFHLLKAARVNRTTAEALAELGEEGANAVFISKLVPN
ncbi:glycosyltransferase [Sphingomonas immobilis]|uniref:Glycosyltransferase n=1 Tax=Sphingomonas immobilis TaxID=3063997 RepID=A0ABT9A3B1_9SPHN|nr:glycosyltransferase [Sphingomonas sp. CA1-15]MDO7843695.1 glycosyltransferase [Sphingomonas sp. CA1-15]